MKEMNFTFAYERAMSISMIVNGLDDDFKDTLEDFIEPTSERFLTKISRPNKDTILHDFIRSITDCHYDEHVLDDMRLARLLFQENSVAIPPWLNEEEVDEHRDELQVALPALIERLTEAVFYILFADRNFLFSFQEYISPLVASLKKSKHRRILSRDGMLRRPTHIPIWLKNAVFHRDKGRCQICWTDLTGLLIPVRDFHLDHMLPLAASGTNDPTNFQLVCKECNLRKNRNIIVKPQKIFPYW